VPGIPCCARELDAHAKIAAATQAQPRAFVVHEEFIAFLRAGEKVSAGSLQQFLGASPTP